MKEDTKGDQPCFCGSRQSYSQPRSASRGEPFRSPMNNYWMTNNAMELTADRFEITFRDDFNTATASDARSRPPSLILFSLIWLCSCQGTKAGLCECLHRFDLSKKRV
jgi:hypothetical protein